ncbi:MAG: DUF58 domain-containing protein [Anaerolineae bacterium]|nr:DUF58 domain-containing protein [Anaerolineae bacterium]
MAERIFDEKTLRKLNKLQIVAKHVRAGQMKGERRSVRRGTSIEFADYRNYARGDDLRRLDWNVYARLDRPFIKLFEEEEDLAVYLLLDASASMDWPREGNPDEHKFTFAQRVIAGLAYISLGSGDRLFVASLGGKRRNAMWGPLRGRGYTLGMLDFIGGLEADSVVDLNTSMRDFAMRTTRPGLCIIVSDLMSATGYQDGLSALQARGHEVTLIHVLSPDEVTPALTGDLQLLDIETNATQDVSVDEGMRELYVKRLLTWRDEISGFCTKRGIHYATIETSTAWDELILFELRRLGVVK